MSTERFITVKAVDSGHVALFERDPAHPGGEAYVAGDKPVRIGRTPIVEQKIRDGVLVEVSATKTPDKAESATEGQPDVVPEPKAKTVKKG